MQRNRLTVPGKRLSRYGNNTDWCARGVVVSMLASHLIIIIKDIYKAPFLSSALNALQIYTTSTIHNAQATISSNHM